MRISILILGFNQILTVESYRNVITFSLSSNIQKNGVMAPTSRACVVTPIMWFSIRVISPNNTEKSKQKPWLLIKRAAKLTRCAKHLNFNNNNFLDQANQKVEIQQLFTHVTCHYVLVALPQDWLATPIWNPNMWSFKIGYWVVLSLWYL